MRLSLQRAFGLGIAAAVIGASVAALAPAEMSGPKDLRTLSDDELRQYIGADDVGPGQPPPRDCFLSAASCSPVIPCPPQGAYECTTCVTGPTSFICRDAQTSGCTVTGMVGCPSAGRGTCFAGTCVVTVAQECGIYYTCR